MQALGPFQGSGALRISLCAAPCDGKCKRNSPVALIVPVWAVPVCAAAYATLGLRAASDGWGNALVARPVDSRALDSEEARAGG